MMVSIVGIILLVLYQLEAIATYQPNWIVVERPPEPTVTDAVRISIDFGNVIVAAAMRVAMEVATVRALVAIRFVAHLALSVAGAR